MQITEAPFALAVSRLTRPMGPKEKKENNTMEVQNPALSDQTSKINKIQFNVGHSIIFLFY